MIVLPVNYNCKCIFYKNAHSDLLSSKILKTGETEVAHNSLLKTGVAPKVSPNTSLTFDQFSGTYVVPQLSNSNISRLFRAGIGLTDGQSAMQFTIRPSNVRNI